MRNALKLFGLCMLAALSLMALGTGAAQAEITGEWRIDLKDGKGLQTFQADKITEKDFLGTVGGGDLLTEGGLEVGCENGNITGTAFVGGTAKAHVLFNGCTVLGSSQCKVYEDLKEGEDGKISGLLGEGHILASGTGTLLLHKGKHYLLVLGLKKLSLKKVEESVFSLFDIYGKFCPLNEGTNPFHVEVTGNTVLELPDALEDLKLHTIKSIDPATLKTLFPNHQLFLGSEKAHLAGGITASVHLVSEEIWGSE